MTTEQLKSYGINVEDLTYPHGEMNIIVQCFGSSEEVHKDDPAVYPSIFHPRKNSVWSCAEHGDGISVETEEEKEDYIKHLKDSAGRLRIMALLLEKQAKELKENGYISTDCYYPDIDSVKDAINNFIPEDDEVILVSNDNVNWRKGVFAGFTGGTWFGEHVDEVVCVRPIYEDGISHSMGLELYNYYKKLTNE